MKLRPIINSPLEQDLYKENMAVIILKKYSDRMTRWSWKCRNPEVRFTEEMIDEIREQVDWYCVNVRYGEDDIEWLRKTCPWLSPGYLAFLRHWRPNRKQIFINEGGVKPYNDCGLAIEAYGTWLDTSKYEIPILAIVSEVYYAFKYGVGAKDAEFKRRADEKFGKLRSAEERAAQCAAGGWTKDIVDKYENAHPYDIGTFAEFGMRRRLSAETQDWLVGRCVGKKVPGFVGTSNMYLARKYGVKPIGTMAHELLQVIGQSDPSLNPAFTNRFVMKDWTEEYKTLNGIMLDDVIGSEVFLKDFDLTYANLFSGVRHDSGDPIKWGETLIAHYKKLGIDPKTKTLLFSDSLNFEKATAIKKHFDGQCKISFGIGTYLSCDTDVEPLNIVMKVTECDGRPVAKLSNNAGKTMCKDAEYVEYLKRCIDWRLRYEKD